MTGRPNMSHARPFFEFVAVHYPTPEASAAAFFDDMTAAAASIGATLGEMPLFDGRRHHLPNAAGKKDQKQFYLASIEADADGTVWPCITFKSFKGDAVYWKPRDLAFREFQAGRQYPTTANDNARQDYSAAAAAAIAAAAESAAQADRRKSEGQTAAAVAAVTAWEAAEPCEAHAYLTRKAVPSHGLRVAGRDMRARLWSDQAGEWQDVLAMRAGDLLIPMHNEAGQLVNLQRIDIAGRKRFIMGGRAHGCHFRIAGAGRTILAEGYATGATWHAATGDCVVLAFSAGALGAVAEYIVADGVAADNDEKSAGEKGAQATGLRYLMPPTLGDWNDYAALVGMDGVRAAVANDNAQAFTRPYDLPAFELKGREATWWNKLAKAETPAEAAALAWAIARRLCVRVPVEMTLDDLTEQLRNGAAAGMMNSATVDAMRAALARMIEWRQRRALAGVSFSAQALRSHLVESVAQLPTLAAADYSGVLLLNSPMGSGKTRRIGKPFADWAKHQDRRFIASCHRQSLVRELARVLGCDHYQETDRETAWSVQALATCLPSIVKHEHGQIIEEAGYLFLDEIAQVLRSLASQVTVADKKTRADVFRALRNLVSRARCIVGADAGMDDRVLAFLESCRPGERFRVIQQPHRADGLAVRYGYGHDALATAYGEALARLSQGQRLWIACGEKSRAIEAARVLEAANARVLLLHGDNRENAAQAAFWRDPEAVSREYDCVIHTGVISSGMSIEHRDAGQHFTHGMLLASGATITPADALQMLRRVRYLRTWTGAVTPNNARDIDNADAIMAGMEQAADLEGLARTCTDFDGFVAGIEADNARHRADFAAGLWWALEHQCFDVQRLAINVDGQMDGDLVAIRAAIRAERREAILAAQELSAEEARRLRARPSRTEEQQFALLRYRIKTDMGLDDLADAELDDWDDGRGPRQMDRFSGATQALADRNDSTADDLALRRFGKARALAYSWLFAGIDLAPGLRITADLAQEIVGRVIERRYLLAYLGVVPAKWARYLAEGKGFPMPAYPVREVGEILERMGLDLKQRRSHKKAPVGAGMGELLKGETPHLRTQNRVIVGTDSWYEITSISWERVAMLAERRNRYRLAVAVKVATDDEYWLGVRRRMLARVHTLTAETAVAELRTHLESRPLSFGARSTVFWARHVLAERLAA